MKLTLLLFSQWKAGIWNGLYESIIDCNSVNTLESRLDKFFKRKKVI